MNKDLERDNDNTQYALCGEFQFSDFHGSVHINDTPKTYHQIYHNLSKVPIKTLGRKKYIFLEVFNFINVY